METAYSSFAAVACRAGLARTHPRRFEPCAELPRQMHVELAGPAAFALRGMKQARSVREVGGAPRLRCVYA